MTLWPSAKPLDPVAFPPYLNYECPICEEPITLSVLWQKEHGEAGTVVSMYPEIERSPVMVDKHGHCKCDFNFPLIDALADYLEDGRLEDLLFPNKQIEQDLIEVLRLANSGLGMLSPEEFEPMLERVERLTEFFGVSLEETK